MLTIMLTWQSSCVIINYKVNKNTLGAKSGMAKKNNDKKR